MSARIPSTYADAPKLSADARGALACARLVWESLGDAQKNALREMWTHEGRLQMFFTLPPKRVRESLCTRGLVDGVGRYSRLTALGVLVREAGIRSTVEVDDAAQG
jgi:hypothetical protein